MIRRNYRVVASRGAGVKCGITVGVANRSLTRKWATYRSQAGKSPSVVHRSTPWEAGAHV